MAETKQDWFLEVDRETALSALAAGYQRGKVYPLRDKLCLTYLDNQILSHQVLDKILEFNFELKVVLVLETLASGLYLIPKNGDVAYFFDRASEEKIELDKSYDIVISYSVNDYAIANLVAQNAREKGLSVYIFEIGDATQTPL